jgi:hypothetical protein
MRAFTETLAIVFKRISYDSSGEAGIIVYCEVG